MVIGESPTQAVPPPRKKTIGILGCGAIGSRIAKSVTQELSGFCQLTGLFDVIADKVTTTANSLAGQHLIRNSFPDLLDHCQLLVEAINTEDALPLIRQALSAKKDVLVMSVGRLLAALDIAALAKANGVSLLIPSGAIAGIDTIKAASLLKIEKITLTTRKPLNGFKDNAYIRQCGINLAQIRGETTIFEGAIDAAVKYFPQNLNVAATLALASQAKEKISIRIMTSPQFTTNSHEIEVIGDFGRMISRTENVICPDNPKTSYLAVLSGIQTLKEFCSGGVRVGT